MSLAHLGRIEEARATAERAEEEFGENLRRYLQRPPWLRPEDYVVRVEGLRLMGLQE
jgi:adenylate cyclase